VAVTESVSSGTWNQKPLDHFSLFSSKSRKINEIVQEIHFRPAHGNGSPNS
jgi:hypothetical protein